MKETEFPSQAWCDSSSHGSPYHRWTVHLQVFMGCSDKKTPMSTLQISGSWLEMHNGKGVLVFLSVLPYGSKLHRLPNRKLDLDDLVRMTHGICHSKVPSVTSLFSGESCFFSKQLPQCKVCKCKHC